MRDWKRTEKTQRHPQKNWQGTMNCNDVMASRRCMDYSMEPRFQENDGDHETRERTLSGDPLTHSYERGEWNRSRADSSSSSFSYSSSGFSDVETPLLSSHQKKHQKRSNRPRGCRGGSSRRGTNRKTSGLLQSYPHDGSFPASAGFDPQPTYNQPEQNFTDDIQIENFHPRERYHHLRNEQQEKPPTKKEFSSTGRRSNSLQKERTTNSHTSSLRSTDACTISTSNSNNCNELDNKKSGTSLYFSSDRSYRNKSQPDTTSSRFNVAGFIPFASTFNFLHPSSSHGHPVSDSIPASLSSTSSSSSEFILPPLPTDAIEIENPAIVLKGPNPYALNSSLALHLSTCPTSALPNAERLNNISSTSVTTEQRVTTDMFCPSIGINAKDCTIDAANSERTLATSMATKKPILALKGVISLDNEEEDRNIPMETMKCDVTYRSARIEIQRQMMAQGGSLFVTSPRSFLMGWRKTVNAKVIP